MDLFYIFFKLRTAPEHYNACRLWKVPKEEWVYYWGCPYTPVSWGRIAKRVYPFDYAILYNNKLVGAQLCKSLSVRQPTTYCMLEPDASFRDRLAAVFQSSGQRQLMLKPVFGRSGIGIAMVEQRDNGIFVRTSSAEMPLAEFRLEYPVFLQEVLRQDPRIAAIWHSSVNTMRIVTMLTASDDVIILGGTMRFGVGKSIVDNWSAGGVASGIETETGRLRKYAGDMLGNSYTQHPSSQFTFEGFEIPEWQRILDAARAIQREIPFSRIAGLDLCLNENAQPILIEINGLPDVTGLEQLNAPLLSDPQTLKAFAEYGLLTGPQRRLIER